MINPKLKHIIDSLQKIINEKPFIAKSVFIHIGIVVALVILSNLSALRFSSDLKIEAEVQKNKPKNMQIIQATSISSSELDKQIKAYDDHQQELKDAREKLIKAKEEARKKAIAKAKQKAEAERKAKEEAQRKVEEEKKAKEEAERKAKEEAQRKIEEEKKAKAEAERKAKEEAIKKAREEAEAKARKEVEQNQAQRAISSYISEYQDRVGSNWIKDDCRGIYDLPRAIIRNGKFMRLTGSSGNYRCDKSLIDAIQNTTPPVVTNSIAKQTLERENVSFIFKQS